jgi:prepilin-type N-terminal cleavage/methylation domain-containing protein/prepilin-type processing-associated H-X9-DG protein
MSGGSTFRGLQCPAGARRRAFTLIELLVVISILVLLMAMLLPVFSRARKQARAVVCQANLRQWGTLMATAVSENNGRFPTLDRNDPYYREGYWGWAGGWGNAWDPDWYEETNGIRCYPMAAKPASPSGHGPSYQGGTFLAWGRMWPEGVRPEPWRSYDSYGSYGFNQAVGHHWWWDETDEYYRERAWRTIDVRGRDRIPVQLDSAMPLASYFYWRDHDWPPPVCDAIPTISVRTPDSHHACIDRHAGGINAVFLDWSVRKVGLKELWTLKWDRQFDTEGLWTKAGGVLPGDWPAWMRKFKDY